MTKKTILILTLVLSLTLAGTYVWAHGPGQGRGGSSGWGAIMGTKGGHMMGWHQGGPWAQVDEETAKLRTDLQRKRIEMMALFAKETLDEEQIKAVHDEMNKLRTELSNKRLELGIKFKKENPDKLFPFPGGPRHGQFHGGPGSYRR
ncbi:MAG: hypothetical protein JRI95_14170 [Deltaproteobacteria bacterium]|nr:hypothetical protein [Deltaproteobacteria bacterium]